MSRLLLSAGQVFDGTGWPLHGADLGVQQAVDDGLIDGGRGWIAS